MTRWQLPPHPGEIFRDKFRRAQRPPMSEVEAAGRLGWTLTELHEFEAGEILVTPSRAADLEALTGTSADVWMSMQARRHQWTGIPKRYR